MAPFLVGGAVTFYLVNFAQETMLKSMYIKLYLRISKTTNPKAKRISLNLATAQSCKQPIDQQQRALYPAYKQYMDYQMQLLFFDALPKDNFITRYSKDMDRNIHKATEFNRQLT